MNALMKRIFATVVVSFVSGTAYAGTLYTPPLRNLGDFYCQAANVSDKTRAVEITVMREDGTAGVSTSDPALPGGAILTGVVHELCFDGGCPVTNDYCLDCYCRVTVGGPTSAIRATGVTVTTDINAVPIMVVVPGN